MGFVLEHFTNELSVFLLAMMPIAELRGSIPLGISLGIPPIEVFIISVMGNILPVPILLKVFKPIIRFIARTRLFSRPAGYILRKVDKGSEKVLKYELFGLFLLVAIPLPTTGVWTGCGVASFLKLGYKKSLLMISLGVLTAGIIVISLSLLGVAFVNMR
ncbi:MAG: Small multidrug export protein (QacE) [Clostridiales bacterium 38_11]|nr:MAG: Small multidrug export protein (QacE) [Clostridiales bacterium 38_11]HBH12239.1 ligand-binding protein SH3 [Clostridiales bacterium]